MLSLYTNKTVFLLKLYFSQVKYLLGNKSTLQMKDMQHSSLQYSNYAAKFKIIFLQKHFFPLRLECKNTPVHQISRFAQNLQPTFSISPRYLDHNCFLSRMPPWYQWESYGWSACWMEPYACSQVWGEDHCKPLDSIVRKSVLFGRPFTLSTYVPTG